MQVGDIEKANVRRSKDGRPYIRQPDSDKELLYTRASTYAKALSDGGGLCAWKQRMAYIGLSAEPRLLGETDRVGIDGRIAEAMELAGANDAARLGTALHGLTEIMDGTGEPLVREHWNLSPSVWDALDRYVEVTKSLEMLSMEQFVVLDSLKVAGSYDRIVRLPDGRKVVADLKTGSTLRMQEHAIQLALYAHGSPYDPETGVRTPQDMDGLDTSIGLIIHVPADPSVAETRLIGVDLVAGWEMVLLADEVRKSRSRKVGVEITMERIDA